MTRLIFAHWNWKSHVAVHYSILAQGNWLTHISTRLKEHMRYIRNNDIKKSAVVKNSDMTNHVVPFDNTWVLATKPNYYPRIVGEVLEIYKMEMNMNRENSFQLDRTWNPLIDKLKILLDIWHYRCKLPTWESDCFPLPNKGVEKPICL